MPYVQRQTDGAVCGIYTNPQPGYAEEFLEEGHADVTAFLSPKAVTASVTPRQARLALLAAGLLPSVEAAVQAAGGATKISWEFATVIERNSPLIETLGGSLGLTGEQIDTLFRFAATQ